MSPLPTGIDQQPSSEMSFALCVAGEDRKRKVGKQPPPGKPKAKANTKGEPKKKKLKTKSAAMSSQAEGGEEEEGEEEDDDDDDDDDKACEGKDRDEKDAEGNDVEEKNKQKTVARAKAKAKGDGGKRRDASKGKKFLELFQGLPGDLKEHYASLSRSEATDFVHAAVERSDSGKLSLNMQSMWTLKMKKEEKQKAQERLSGCVLEDQLDKT